MIQRTYQLFIVLILCSFSFVAKLSAQEQTLNTPKGIILSLHGFAAGPWTHEFFFQLSSVAKANQLVLVTPKAPRNKIGARFWDVGLECCDFFNEADEKAHQKIIEDSLEETLKKLQLDANKTPIFMFGHSNGSFMAHKMACHSKYTFKGVITISGGFLTSNAPFLPPYCPHPPEKFIHIHGEKDNVIPIDGRFPFPSMEATRNHWARQFPFQTRDYKVRPISIDNWSGQEQSIVWKTGKRSSQKTHSFYWLSFEETGHFSRWSDKQKYFFWNYLTQTLF